MYTESRKKARSKYNKKYYTARRTGNRLLSDTEMWLIEKRIVSDRELSEIIDRSMTAILQCRHKLKYGQKSYDINKVNIREYAKMF